MADFFWKSCGNCGVVIDGGVVTWTVVDYSNITEENSVWNGEEHVPFTICPVCKEKIPKEEPFE